MQIRETIDNPSTASTECPPEDVILLVDSTGVALGVQHAFSAKVLTDCEANPAWLLIEASAGRKQSRHRSGRTPGLVRAFV
jgi:hypothetical protein